MRRLDEKTRQLDEERARAFAERQSLQEQLAQEIFELK